MDDESEETVYQSVTSLAQRACYFKSMRSPTNSSQDSQWKPMLLCIWKINEIKSIKQKLKVKNI
jgi:hypothetical protein